MGPTVIREELTALVAPKQSQPTAVSGEEDQFDAVEQGAAPSASASSGSVPATPTPAPAKKWSLPRVDVWVASFAAWFFELRWNFRDAVESGGQSLTGILFTTVTLKVLALASTAIIGVAIGLTVSGLVQNSAQAVMWVPLLLIPQILFGGVVLSLPELSRSARAVSQIVPSFSCQRLMDVSIVHGQALPLFSNRTKVPLFLTPGEKETIRWKIGDREYSEVYDKLAPANTSWQNLTVFAHAVGRHRHVFSEVLTAAGSKKRIYNETAESRDDIRYSKGRVFLDFSPVVASCAVTLFWLALCYGGTSLALALRQKGK